MRIAVRNLRENNGKNDNQNNDHDDTSDDKNSFHFANSFLHFASLLQLVVSITRDRSGVFDRLFDSFDFLPLTIRLLSTLIKLILSAHLPGVQLKLLFPGTRCLVRSIAAIVPLHCFDMLFMSFRKVLINFSSFCRASDGIKIQSLSLWSLIKDVSSITNLHLVVLNWKRCCVRLWVCRYRTQILSPKPSLLQFSTITVQVSYEIMLSNDQLIGEM